MLFMFQEGYFYTVFYNCNFYVLYVPGSLFFVLNDCNLCMLYYYNCLSRSLLVSAIRKTRKLIDLNLFIRTKTNRLHVYMYKNIKTNAIYLRVGK